MSQQMIWRQKQDELMLINKQVKNQTHKYNLVFKKNEQ